MAFFPTGTTLASAAGDWADTGEGEVKVWDVASGRLRFSLKEHDRTMFAVAFSPDGKTLASGGRDQAITLWDVATGRALKTCVGHEEAVRSIAFHPEGHALASSGFDKTVRIWDAQYRSTDRIAARTRRHRAKLRGDFSRRQDAGREHGSRGRRQRQPDTDLGLGLQKGAGGSPRQPLQHLVSRLLSQTGKVLASGGGRIDTDGEVKLWDVSKRKLIADLKGHTRRVESVGFSGQDQTFISAGGIDGENGEIKLWQPGPPPPPVQVRPVPF